MGSKRIVIINGIGGSGKDTFIKFVSKYVKVENISAIDKVKEVARLCGWNGEKDEKSRNFLASLKEITSAYNDMTFKDICEKVEAFKSSDKEILFIHVREPYNVCRMSFAFDCETLLVKRVNHEDLPKSKVDSNDYVEGYNYDYIVINDSLESLDNSARKFVGK